MISKRIYFILLLALPTILLAQNNTVRKEILNYKDSTVEFITQGRKFLTNMLLEGNVEKVKEIKNSILLEENERHLAFYPIELQLLLYWTGEYDELEAYLHSLDEQTIAKMKLKIQPVEDVLYTNLLNTIRKDCKKVEKEIMKNGGNDEKRDYLLLNLHYLIKGQDYKEVTLELLNNESDAFLLNYPASVYTEFIRKYIRYKTEVSPWGYGFEFFSGYGFGSGQLNSKFGGNVPFGVAFDVIYKKWTLYLRDYIGIGSTHCDIPIKGIVWPQGEKANIILPEASLGYSLPIKFPINISPFAGIGALLISPPSGNNNEYYYKQVGELSGFSWNVGVNFDVRLGKSSNSIPIVSYNESAFWYLRVRYGFIMSNIGSHYSGFDGNMHYLTIGISGIGHKIKRVY